MTVRLRAHHLLCMLTYVGKGYTPDFCDNYDRIAIRLGAGETILLVEGPDDLCAPVVDGVDSHCRNDSVTERDAAAATAVSTLLGHGLSPGTPLSLDAAILQKMRDAFAAGTTRTGCGGCQWIELCDGIAASDFDGVRLIAS